MALEYYHLDNTRIRKCHKVPVHVKWEPLPTGIYQLSTDGAFKDTKEKHEIGVICNSNGQWIVGFEGAANTATAMETELSALLHGLNLATKHHATANKY